MWSKLTIIIPLSISLMVEHLLRIFHLQIYRVCKNCSMLIYTAACLVLFTSHRVLSFDIHRLVQD